MKPLLLLWLIPIGIFALLFVRLRLRFTYCDRDGLHMDGRCLFIRFFAYPRPARVKLRRYRLRPFRKRLKKAAQKKNGAAQKATKPKKRSAIQSLRLVLYVLSKIKGNLPRLFRVRIKRLCITVGSDDAAKTALLYGAAAQLVAGLTETLERFLRLDFPPPERYGVQADFTAQSTSADIEISLSAPIYRLLWVGIKVMFYYLLKVLTGHTGPKKGDNHHGRKQNQ